jgi:GT2 family glycosyltransferase
MRTAIVTIAHVAFDEQVVVAIADPAFETVARRVRDTPTRVIHLDAHAEGLPLAAARNAGARAALGAGADLLIFLDVDCLPGPELVGGYVDAATADATRGALLCGPVTYLDPPGPTGYELELLDDYDSPHPARPAPRRGETLLGGPHELFWSLSFALDASNWARIGGFCEDYVGYGGEDTDFGQRARSSGVPLAWVGDARAYHQHHPTTDPPVQHLDAILRNAAVFESLWGWWPMQGWLDGFERAGLIEREAAGTYRRTSTG